MERAGVTMRAQATYKPPQNQPRPFLPHSLGTDLAPLCRFQKLGLVRCSSNAAGEGGPGRAGSSLLISSSIYKTAWLAADSANETFC